MRKSILSDLSQCMPACRGRWLVIFYTLLLISSIAAAPAFSVAFEPAVLEIDPPVVGIKPGEEVQVSVRLCQVDQLYGAELTLSYDPDLIEVVDMDASVPGGQIEPGEIFKAGFVAINRVDNTIGKVEFAATLLNPMPAFNGEGQVALLTLRGKGEGSGQLTIVEAVLASREASQIPSTTTGADLQVSASGKAPAGASSIDFANGTPVLFYLAAGLGIAAFLAAAFVLARVLRQPRA